VIMIRPLQMQMMNVLLLERMRAVFVEKLGLDFVKPFRFVIYNRKGKRYVLNCYKLFDRFVPLFPNITLELYEDAFQANVSANIRYYNEMLFAFGCHSSGFLNIIFQQSNTVFAVVESKQSDGHLFVGIAKIFKRHAFIYRDFQFEHSARVLKLPMNQIVPLVELAIRRAIKIQENNVRTEKADCVSALLSFGFSIDPPS
jgi:hypothetical protein